jgi:GTP-binding protein EngB required for normal cell division
VQSSLNAIAEIATTIGAEAIAVEALDLASRLTEGRFFVACLGQFKRGKSTVLNALLGEPILPTGVVPVTSAVTVVRHGPVTRATVRYHSGVVEEIAVNELAQYVTEPGNPRNTKGVAVVEVFHPCALLRDGLCLVDTPGLGSASPLSTEVTRRFIPHIDAALVIVGADPPLTGDELDLIQQVTGETQQFIFVINKADKLSDAELSEIVVFTQRLLMDHLRAVPERIFIVSARERPTSGQPTRDWPRLVQALTTLGQEGKAALVGQRISRVQHRLTRQLRQAVDATAEALVAPVDESARRVQQVRDWQTDAERALGDLRVLLASEQQAIATKLRDDIDRAVAARRPAIAAELRQAINRELAAGRPQVRQHALTVAQDMAKRALRQELEAEEGRAVAAHRRAAERFVELANRLLDRLARAEPRLGELPPLTPPTTLAGTRRFHFTSMMRLTARTPWEVLADVFATRSTHRDRVLRHAIEYLDRLLETNTGRVASDLDERLLESRRVLEDEVRARLTSLVTSAVRAAARAKELKAVGESAVRLELDRLAQLRQRIDALAVAADDDAPNATQ